jgi:hypothetical protein
MARRSTKPKVEQIPVPEAEQQGDVQLSVAAAEEAQVPETEQQGIRFKVTAGVVSISFAEGVYPANEDGEIMLPAGEDWYQELIGNTLFPVE